MNRENRNRVDSHIHLDLALGADLINTMLANNISAVSWAGLITPQESIHDFKEYFENQKKVCSHIRSKGIEAYRLVGIIPHSIPKAPATCEQITKILKHAINSEDVVGIGEIGLETGSPTEEMFLRSQLSVAKEHDLPIGVHTPRKNKRQMFKKTLSIIREYNFKPEKVLIDHINSDEMLREVLENGFYAGITINNNKLSVEQAKTLIERAIRWNKSSENKIMLNSDMTKKDAKEYKPFIKINDFISDEASAVLGQTARAFYRLEK